jgi:molecular chaperone GrpE (heat shock protein)
MSSQKKTKFDSSWIISIPLLILILAAMLAFFIVPFLYPPEQGGFKKIKKPVAAIIEVNNPPLVENKTNVSAQNLNHDFKIVNGIKYYRGARLISINGRSVTLLYPTQYYYISLEEIPSDTALKMGADPLIVRQIEDERMAEHQRLVEMENQRLRAEEQENEKRVQIANEAAQNEARKLAEAAEQARLEKARCEAKEQAIGALKRDLNAAIDDLKSKWFPKRTKVENYNVIDLTAMAIIQSGGSNPYEELLQRQNNPYGLTQGDIVGIIAAHDRNMPANTSALESKIDSLSSQNARLQDQMDEVKNAAQDAADDARDANMELERARVQRILNSYH